MTMEDVWLETIHESERRDRKKNNSVPVSKDKVSAQDTKKRPAAGKDNPPKDNRGQKRKRAASASWDSLKPKEWNSGDQASNLRKVSQQLSAFPIARPT